MSIDERLKKHLEDAKGGDVRLAAMLSKTRAMLESLLANQERIDRQVEALRSKD